MSTDITSTTTGIILAIAASIFNAIGYTVQKQGHNRLKEYNKDKDKSDKKRIIREKTWAIGFGIYLIGGLLNAVSLFYAPQSLVLPLSAVTLVANTLLATKILGEPFIRSDMFGVLSVIVGSVLAVIFGPRTGGDITSMHELKLRWIDIDFYPFFMILSICMILDYLIVKYYEKKNAQHVESNDTEVNDTQQIQYGSSLLLLSYCLLSAYFGSLAFLFLKSLTHFIGQIISSNVFRRKSAYNYTFNDNWYLYVTVVLVVVTNIALELFRQRGLSRFNAVYVVPINQVILIAMGTVVGGLYFEEFNNMAVMEGLMFCVAILMTVIGVFILTLNSGTSMKSTTNTNMEACGGVDVQEWDPPEIYAIHRAMHMASIPLFSGSNVMSGNDDDVLPTEDVHNEEVNNHSQSEVDGVLL